MTRKETKSRKRQRRTAGGVTETERQRERAGKTFGGEELGRVRVFW